MEKLEGESTGQRSMEVENHEGQGPLWAVVPLMMMIVIIIALMIEALRTSETSVNIYLTTRQYITEDSKLQGSLPFTACLCETAEFNQ
jgi:hypothetical protein